MTGTITGPDLNGPNPIRVEQVEEVIRDLAGTVINSVHVRRAHPSYGYTKKMIDGQYERMEGAIGLYMVLTNQSSHAGFPSGAKFVDEATTERVRTARRRWQEL